jgi:hypothetical protein
MKRWTFTLLFVVSCASSSPATSESGTSAASEASPRGVPCENEIAKVCAEPMKDGCLVQIDGAPATLVHRCIHPATDAPPCTQEIARQCPEGSTDACLESPAAAKHHLCVEPAGSPKG